jgi:PEP-CTERM motif
MKKILWQWLWLTGATFAGGAHAAPEIVRFHQATAESFHCCWDIRQNYDSDQGPGAYDATSWNASAHADGTASHGAIGGNVSASAQRFESWAGSSGTGRVRDYFVDTFTITSPTLAFGTPVQVQLGISMQFTTTSQRTTGADARAFANAVWHFNGPDAPWIVGVVFDRESEGLGAFDETRSALTSFASTVGGSFTLVGDLLLHATASATDNPSSASAAMSADARYTVEVLTPQAGFSSASGATYVTAVPEPSAVLMLGAGLLVLLHVQRGRKAAPQPGI